MTKKIPLGKGKFTLIDSSDYDLVSQRSNWRAHSNQGGCYYAISRNPRGQNPRDVSMHRLIMGLDSHQRVDHVNRNGLDNRRSNLRHATRSQNGANRKISSNNSSGYKGVIKRWSKWAAVITVNQKKLWLGSFTSKIVAAKAYDEAAIYYFGEFALTNFKGGR